MVDVVVVQVFDDFEVIGFGGVFDGGVDVVDWLFGLGGFYGFGQCGVCCMVEVGFYGCGWWYYCCVVGVGEVIVQFG